MAESTLKDGVCPKCDSTEVYVRNGNGHRGALWMGWTALSAVVLKDYVCTECGYMEQYVPERKTLDKIREEWDRADGQPKEKNKR